MIGYILLIVFTAFAWMVMAAGWKQRIDGLVIAGCVSGTICSILLLIATINLSVKAGDARIFAKDRDYYENLLNTVSGDVSPITISRIVSKAEYMNEKIERHKRYYNDAILGFIYNEGIATLEPIKIPKYKFSVEKVKDETTEKGL